MDKMEQLNNWVDGISIHDNDRDECCPDFSCCRPELLASRAEREAFREAHLNGDERTTISMLGMFLGQAFSDINIHIAGEISGEA